jgi:hypothetical protein
MDITKAIEIIKEYGNGIGTSDILLTLNEMLDDEDISNRDRAARNLFMYEGRKMFESIKIQVTI